MKLSDLIERMKGRVGAIEQRGVGDPDVLRVCEDSRKVRPGDLFVARGGTKTTGAKFLADALAKGAVAVVCREAADLSVPLILVKDAGFTGALLAHEAAGNPTAGMKMIGVTGTKGKTTVAYLMRSVLKAAGHKVGMIGTVEIDDGKTVVPADMTTPGVDDLVALFCRMRDHGVTHCVMEVSSHALHQHRVAGVDFPVAIFTNLTGDHLDYHKTMDEYAAAKAILFEGLSNDAVAVVNADDNAAGRVTARCPAKTERFAVDGVAEWTAVIESMTSVGTQLAVTGPDGHRRRLFSPLVGKHNVYNTLCAIAAGRSMGITIDTIESGLDVMQGVPGRLQAVVPHHVARGQLTFQVFVDYAHTHDALENVLRALRTTMGPGRLICLFGCGGDRDRTKRPKMGAVAERLADRVIVTSDNPRTEEPGAIIDEICAGFSAGWKDDGKITVEPDRRAAIRAAIAMATAGDVVLIAGKGHENYQIIGTTKHHFDDVEEAQAALTDALSIKV